MLTLAGEVWTDVTAAPMRLSFGELGLGEKATQPLSLKVREPDSVTIDDIIVDDKRLTVVPVESTEPGTKKYEVRFAGGKERGRLRGSLRVTYKTKDGSGQTAIPFSGEVVGDLRFPNRIVMSKEAKGFSPRTIDLTHRSGKPVRVLAVKDPEGRLTAKILPPKPAAAEIELTVAHEVLITAQGNLEVTTDAPSDPKLKIPYTLYVPNDYRTVKRITRGADMRPAPSGSPAAPPKMPSPR